MPEVNYYTGGAPMPPMGRVWKAQFLNWRARRRDRSELKRKSKIERDIRPVYPYFTEPLPYQGEDAVTKHVQIGRSRFMELPAEIRLMIYSYLIPNRCVREKAATLFHPFRNTFRRYDGKPCYPALLRTNRKIHHEMISWFYSLAHFCAALNSVLYFGGGWQYDRFSQLPFGFRFITSFRLITLCKFRSYEHAAQAAKVPEEGIYPSDCPREMVDQRRRIQSALARHFSSSGPGNLTDFELWVDPAPQLFAPLERVPNRREAIRECLEFNLHSLKDIRPSRMVYLRFCRVNEASWTTTYRGCANASMDFKRDVSEVMQEYGTWLLQEITGSRDERV